MHTTILMAASSDSPKKKYATSAHFGREPNFFISALNALGAPGVIEDMRLSAKDVKEVTALLFLNYCQAINVFSLGGTDPKKNKLIHKITENTFRQIETSQNILPDQKTALYGYCCKNAKFFCQCPLCQVKIQSFHPLLGVNKLSYTKAIDYFLAGLDLREKGDQYLARLDTFVTALSEVAANQNTTRVVIPDKCIISPGDLHNNQGDSPIRRVLPPPGNRPPNSDGMSFSA